MLELIRGISSPALRKEFLKQSEPSLEDLIQIAKNWQRSTDVTKNMEEATIESRKASTSSYKKGKKEEWKAKSGDKSGGKFAQDKSGDQTKKCAQCGRRLCKGPDRCIAKGKTCHKCGEEGHFARVCSVNVESSDESSDEEEAVKAGQVISESYADSQALLVPGQGGLVPQRD